VLSVVLVCVAEVRSKGLELNQRTLWRVEARGVESRREIP
jgi:hypothetical protein